VIVDFADDPVTEPVDDGGCRGYPQSAHLVRMQKDGVRLERSIEIDGPERLASAAAVDGQFFLSVERPHFASDLINLQASQAARVGGDAADRWRGLSSTVTMHAVGERLLLIGEGEAAWMDPRTHVIGPSVELRGPVRRVDVAPRGVLLSLGEHGLQVIAR
jgi:hypothetical protein